MDYQIPQIIHDLLNDKDYPALKNELKKLEPFELADTIYQQNEASRITLFQLLDLPSAIATFSYLPLKVQKQLLNNIPVSQSAQILNELEPYERTKFLQELPQNIINEFVKLLSKKERELSLKLLGYPENSIGRLMTTDYIAVKKEWTIEKSLDQIMAYGHDSETIDVIYVIDENGRLLDDFNLRYLLFQPRHKTVASILDGRFVALSVFDNDETAYQMFEETDRVALPVIDDNQTLLGIVTIDDVLRLVHQEATEDMQKIGGMEALDEPYLQTPFLMLMKKRAGWLIILFLGEMMTATALAYFQDEIAKAVVLALFLPLIISSGGNAGSQASTLIIRAMAIGEVKLRDWWTIMRREIPSGLFLGNILGIIGFCRVSLWSMFSTIYGEHWFLIAVTIYFSLIGVVMWGSFVGSMLPFVLRACKVDPATSSAPFVATLVDVTGVIIYFFIAIIVLQGTLL